MHALFEIHGDGSIEYIHARVVHSNCAKIIQVLFLCCARMLASEFRETRIVACTLFDLIRICI